MKRRSSAFAAQEQRRWNGVPFRLCDGSMGELKCRAGSARLDQSADDAALGVIRRLDTSGKSRGRTFTVSAGTDPHPLWRSNAAADIGEAGPKQRENKQHQQRKSEKNAQAHFSIVRLSPACACFVSRSTPTNTTTAAPANHKKRTRKGGGARESNRSERREKHGDGGGEMRGMRMGGKKANKT